MAFHQHIPAKTMKKIQIIHHYMNLYSRCISIWPWYSHCISHICHILVMLTQYIPIYSTIFHDIWPNMFHLTMIFPWYSHDLPMTHRRPFAKPGPPLAVPRPSDALPPWAPSDARAAAWRAANRQRRSAPLDVARRWLNAPLVKDMAVAWGKWMETALEKYKMYWNIMKYHEQWI